MPPSLLLLLVVLREQDVAVRPIGWPVQDLASRLAPAAEMRRLLVGLERLVVAVHLVEEEVVLVGPVLQDVEAQAPRLVAHGADRIVLGSGQEAVAQVRLHIQGHDQYEHGLQVISLGVCTTRLSWARVTTGW